MAPDHGQGVIDLCEDEDGLPRPKKSASRRPIAQPNGSQSKESQRAPRIIDLSGSPDRDLSSKKTARDSQPPSSAPEVDLRVKKRKRYSPALLSSNSRQSQLQSDGHLASSALKDHEDSGSGPTPRSKSSPTPRLMAQAGVSTSKNHKRERDNLEPLSDGVRPDKRQKSLQVPSLGRNTSVKGVSPGSQPKRRPVSGSTTAANVNAKTSRNHEVVDLTSDTEEPAATIAGALGRSKEAAAARRLDVQPNGVKTSETKTSPHPKSPREERTPARESLSRSPLRRKSPRSSALQRGGNGRIANDELGLEIPESLRGTPEKNDSPEKRRVGDTSSILKAAPAAATRLASQYSTGPTSRRNPRAIPLTPSESSADEGSRAKDQPGTNSQSPRSTLQKPRNLDSAINREANEKEDAAALHQALSKDSNHLANTATQLKETTTPAKTIGHVFGSGTLEKTAKSQPSARGAAEYQYVPLASRPLTNNQTPEVSRQTETVSQTKQTDDIGPKASGSTSAQIQGVSVSSDFRMTAVTSSQVEGIARACLNEMEQDHFHWTQTLLQRARHTAETREAMPHQHDEPTSVFSQMKPLPVESCDKKKPEKGFAKFEVSYSRNNKKSISAWSVPCTPFRTDDQDVPSYSHFVKLKHNFLASNETTLQHWPYFDDDFYSDTDLTAEITKQYEELGNVDTAHREEKLLLMTKAEHFADQTEAMLEDLQCSWADVLHFMLDPAPNVGNNAEAKKALLSRDTFCDVKCFRESKRWIEVLSKLPPAVPGRTARVALLCEQFNKLAHFSLWDVARRSEITRSLLEEEKEEQDADKLTCRVCMRLSCPYHGEIENLEDESDSEAGSEKWQVQTDIINPPGANHRLRVTLPETVDDNSAGIVNRRAMHHWQTGMLANLMSKPDERNPFYPCQHPGKTCHEAQCTCVENRIACEKSCACSPACPRKFQGCNCSKKGRGCFNTDNCACFNLGRECDPDLCGDCGVCDVLDHQHRHDDRILIDRCRNASIQRGIPKHTVIGKSPVHGLGLYACEPIYEHEFIGEYKGELITTKEAERRGIIYEHQKLSYLFTLNQSQEVDSTFFGNKMRFINHATKSKCNVYARIVMVNTVHRIGLYAERDIQPGEELAFNYGPHFTFAQDQKNGKRAGKSQDVTQRKAVPQVRNSHLLGGFNDPDYEREPSASRADQKSRGARQHKVSEKQREHSRKKFLRKYSSSSDLKMAEAEEDNTDDYQEDEDEEENLYA